MDDRSATKDAAAAAGSTADAIADTGRMVTDIAGSVVGAATGVASGVANELNRAASEFARSVQGATNEEPGVGRDAEFGKQAGLRSSAAPPGADEGFDNWSGGEATRPAGHAAPSQRAASDTDTSPPGPASASLHLGDLPRSATGRASAGPATGSTGRAQVFGSSVDAPGSAAGAASSGPSGADATAPVKRELLALLSTLDRGLAAGREDTRRVEGAVHRLAALAGAVDLGGGALDGRWRLAYSTSLGATLGAISLPLPLPGCVGQISQEIAGGHVTESASLQAPISLAALVGDRAPALALRARRALRLEGGARVRLGAPRKAELRGSGGVADWFGRLPALETPAWPQGETAQEVLYLDDDLRVMRDDGGNLLIYARADS